MINYDDFKKFVYKIFDNESSEENGKIKISLENRHFSEKKCTLIIEDVELKNIFDSVQNHMGEGLALYLDNSYETIINNDHFMFSREEQSIVVKDEINGIKYTLGYPTIEYAVFLIIKIMENKSRCRLPIIHRLFFHILVDNEEKEELKLKDIFPKMLRKLSIKIESENHIPDKEYQKLKTSFIFNYMYQYNYAINEYSDIEEAFNLNRKLRKNILKQKYNSTPQRYYLSDVVDYYKRGLSSSDPYIMFISCYHVMEYFYDEVFKNKMVSDLRNKITNPGFSYKNDEKIYEVAMFVKNRLKMHGELGQGNELESLRYVLEEYVPVDDLKNRIDELEQDASKYYSVNKVGFCNAPTINWLDKIGLYIQLAKRIYFVRNALVHSKSGKNQERYKPYKDEKELYKEIPLVQSIAELIIINSSKPI